MEYTIHHVVRPIGKVQGFEHYRYPTVEIEFTVKYKNNWLVRIITSKDESTNSWNSYKNLYIENIITNTKAVKKLKLPFRKSKVRWGNHRDANIIKEYNRYAFQLELGIREVKKIMIYILKTWKKEQNYEPNIIIGDRATGVSVNSEGRNRQYINVKNLLKK